MPSSTQIDMKDGGESERVKGKREKFCPSSTASLRQLSIGTWTVGKDVNSCESRGWLLPSTRTGKKEGGLSSNVPV